MISRSISIARPPRPAGAASCTSGCSRRRPRSASTSLGCRTTCGTSPLRRVRVVHMPPLLLLADEPPLPRCHHRHHRALHHAAAAANTRTDNTHTHCTALHSVRCTALHCAAHTLHCTAHCAADMAMEEKLAFLRESRHAFGRTALVLSGGGSFGAFHMVLRLWGWSVGMLLMLALVLVPAGDWDSS